MLLCECIFKEMPQKKSLESSIDAISQVYLKRVSSKLPFPAHWQSSIPYIHRAPALHAHSLLFQLNLVCDAFQIYLTGLPKALTLLQHLNKNPDFVSFLNKSYQHDFCITIEAFLEKPVQVCTTKFNVKVLFQYLMWFHFHFFQHILELVASLEAIKTKLTSGQSGPVDIIISGWL